MEDFNDTIGIFPGDLIIKAVVELSLDDMRKSPWIIDDVFRVLIENPILKQKYGLKEVARAREFILNNDIPVYLAHRVDKQEYPCVTIAIGSSKEDENLATLGDASVCVEEYDPSEIGKTIKFIIPPFNPLSYDKSTGIIEVPEDIEEFEYLSAGMVVVDPDTGGGFTILDIIAPNKIKIQAGASLSKKVAIIPHYQTYRARRERAISQETYNIGCHAHGDPSTMIFLYCVVKYALFRYKEGLLEANNFQLSRLTSTDIISGAMGVENLYSRWITLSGQVEESWVKTPMRTIESMVLKDSSSINGLTQGLKILDGKVAEGAQDECSPWVVIEEEES